MKIVLCPACQARYKVPESKAGKRVKCKKCQHVFTLPEPDSGRLALTDLEDLAGGATVEGSQESAPAPMARPVSGGTPPADPVLGYAASGPPEPPAGPNLGYGAFFRSLGRAMAFPAQHGNLIPFVAMWIALTMGTGLIAALLAICCLLFILSFLIRIYYIGFQLGVVLKGAAGDFDLPPITLSGSIWDDVIVPAVKLLCAYVIARLPAGIFLLSVTSLQQLSGGETIGTFVVFLLGGNGLIAELPQTEHQVIAGALLALGYLLWPMLVLVVAVASVGAVFRLDLIAITIVRTLPVYLLVVLIVYVAFGIQLVGDIVAVTASAGVVAGDLSWGVLIAIAAGSQLVAVYTTIFSMLVIGLYYHHFKHKFAWSWG